MKQVSRKFILWMIASLSAFSQIEAYSGKALGMGNLGAAYPQDSLSAIYNPANSACVGDCANSTLGAAYNPGAAKIRNSPVPTANATTYCRRTWVPVGAMGINKQITCNFSAGFIFYNRFFKKTAYNKSSPLAGTTKLHHVYERHTAAAVFAYNLWDRLQFGITLDCNVGRHKVGGAQNFDNALLTVAPGHVTNKGYNWDWGIGTTAGVLWEINEDWKMGVLFRPETKMSRFHKYKGFIPERGILHTPQELRVGMSWRALPCFTLAFDVQYIWTQRLRAAHNPIVANPILDKLGSKRGSSFGLKPELIFRTGVDFAWTDEVILRAGYINIIPFERKSQAFLCTAYNLPMKHFLTLGASYQWCSFDFDLFWIHGFEHKITGHNAIPVYLGGGDAIHKRSVDLMGISVGWWY